MSAQTTTAAPLTEDDVINALTALDNEASHLISTYRGAQAQSHLATAQSFVKTAKRHVQSLSEQITADLAAQDRETLVNKVQKARLAVRSNAKTETLVAALAARTVANSQASTLQRTIGEKVSFLESQVQGYHYAHAVLSLWAEKSLTVPGREYEPGSPEAEAYSEVLVMIGAGYTRAFERHGLTEQTLTSVSHLILSRLDSLAGSGASSDLRINKITTHLAATKAHIQALRLVQAGLGMSGSGLPYFIYGEHYDTLRERTDALFPEGK